MALLRRIEHPTPGNIESWEDTYAKWDQSTKQILNFPKNKADDGQQEWINMTGFLCALGGVCLQQRHTPGPATYSPPMGPLSERKSSMISVGPGDMTNPAPSLCPLSTPNETPVSCFLDRLLALLVCGHDRVGLHVRTNVKDLLGLELSPALYPMLFNKLKNSIGKFFDTQGPGYLINKLVAYMYQGSFGLQKCYLEMVS
ncbi:Neurofibromin 1 [Characodon lateralis]|uniref:Neurofibromin 1 n=2 Tax=Goodeidae TaxID=28758 RepID=A0ABU7CA76_9TELE|nr:Neurofibromin 1 [Ataeniobius toweri]MED6278966.1 Neurofibromin 1 [Characodon lateralis]